IRDFHVTGVQTCALPIYTFLKEMATLRNVSSTVTYGFSPGNQVRGELIASNPLLEIKWNIDDQLEPQTVKTQLTGSYNMENMLRSEERRVGKECGYRRPK